MHFQSLGKAKHILNVIADFSCLENAKTPYQFKLWTMKE